jgi:hypothetical protein
MTDFNGQLNTASNNFQSLGLDATMAEFRSAAEVNGVQVDNLINPKNLLNSEHSGIDIIKDEQVKNNSNVDTIQTEFGDGQKTTNEVVMSDSSSPLKPAPKKHQDNNTWKQNPLKTKRFVDRISYGFDIQASARTSIFTTSGVLSIQAAYQLTTKMNIGTGIAYIGGLKKYSIEEGRNAMRFKTNGMGCRTYLDWGLTSRFFFQGGYERNYRNTLSESLSLSSSSYVLKESALIG